MNYQHKSQGHAHRPESMTEAEKRQLQDFYLKLLFFGSVGMIIGVVIVDWLTGGK